MFRIGTNNFVRAMQSIGSTISHRSKWKRSEATRKKLIAEAAQREKADAKREEKEKSDLADKFLSERKRIPTLVSPAPPKIPAKSGEKPPTTPEGDKPPTISPAPPKITAESGEKPLTTPAGDKPPTISPAKIMDACDGEEKD